MSVLKQYVFFGVLIWVAGSDWIAKLSENRSWEVISVGVIVFLLFVAVCMTCYVLWRRRKEKQKNRGHNSPLL